MTSDISCSVWHKSNYKFQDGGQNGDRAKLTVSQLFMNTETSFFSLNCAKMAPNISCRSLTEIGLQIPRWRTKWRPCKAMAASQAFIFHFKFYSILNFVVGQHLRWPFLFITREIVRLLSLFKFFLNDWNTVIYYTLSLMERLLERNR